ncbi:MAG: DNA-directed RNA polymerase subunit alpha [Candidatus Rokubacteria bacterium RIFCSPLOWO2_02_FULL_68_19]|nr:MAG: DNA-directed RNA polymerase subunit alpha [Candidatus Rokubacteria bacterium RIFCSPLOWO2_02_FULL_68_19]OGL09924.1 MAG: DNA-directed RNA polymerase subunit alpha [Candidatus Rokubacteria bacterium RIFCSPHIGHO2_02_FULL_69_13]OGL15484.1 MAG: DNA-directed RNA polymerase subunit alpha [Candidatus Rokubacteria bacterium RIFCSPLOWO2_12_FULL_69_21]
MPRIPFQKPKKIEWEDLTDRYGRLVAEPFEKGYALTVGNSLRRTLLAIIPGAAVAWVKIQGVKDPLTRVPGVKEETVDVLLNVKKLAVHVPSGEPTVARVEAKGPKEVTGADVAQGGVEVLNPDLHLATLEPGGRLTLELGVQVGRGYMAADKHPAGTVPAGAIPLDAAFTPIERVSYNVEMSRLGKITDYEKLVLELWTNGAITPEEAIARAATHLRDHFTLLAAEAPEEEEAQAGGEDFLRDTLAKSLEELPLPVRAVNALKNAEILTVLDLVQKTEAEVEKVKNLGEKSLEEIKAALAALGLSLGMRIDPSLAGAVARGGLR